MSSITVYTQPSCGPCTAVKRWLTVNNLPFTEKGPTEALQEGYRTTPVVTYKGLTVFGFLLPELNNLKDLYHAEN